MTHNPALELAAILHKLRTNDRASGTKLLGGAAVDDQKPLDVLRRMAVLFAGVQSQWAELEAAGVPLVGQHQARDAWTQAVFCLNGSGTGWGVTDMHPDAVVPAGVAASLEMFGYLHAGHLGGVQGVRFSTSAERLVMDDLAALGDAIDASSAAEDQKALCLAKVAVLRRLMESGTADPREVQIALAGLLVTVFLVGSTLPADSPGGFMDTALRFGRRLVEDSVSAGAYDLFKVGGSAVLTSMGLPALEA